MLTVDPTKRATVEDVLCSTWLAGQVELSLYAGLDCARRAAVSAPPAASASDGKKDGAAAHGASAQLKVAPPAAFPAPNPFDRCPRSFSSQITCSGLTPWTIG